MSIKVFSVMLVDDHPMVLAGILQMLETSEEFKVVALANDANAAMTALSAHSIDIAIVDIGLPDESGLTLLQRIKRTAPHIRVIVLSAHGEEMYALRAMKAGADGYLTKGAQMQTVLDALQRVANGGKHFSALLSELLVKQIQGRNKFGYATLTPREFDIMLKLVAGESTGSIAEQLHRSPKTISTHRTRLFEKLNIHSNAQLARYAVEHGLIGPTPTKK
jgi:DNA-binding NarL/FixJ family response regulator